MEIDVDKARARKGKGTTTLTLDFNESDDDVFDEEAEDDRASRLTESTINVNTGEKVSCRLENGVSTGKFFAFCLVSSFFTLLYNICF